MISNHPPLKGPRFTVSLEDNAYPTCLLDLKRPPKVLYGIGSLSALKPGLSIIGARKATSYGLDCAQHFSELAARHGITIISGGARGCDSAAHRGALNAKQPTVVVLGGGCDKPYPQEHKELFQTVINEGGAIISEQDWDQEPRPYMFRERNRIIAALGKALLVTCAGLPSGTFTTADEALAIGREVFAVPGAITTLSSRGSNQLIRQGAAAIIDDESFMDELSRLFTLTNCATNVLANTESCEPDLTSDPLVAAIAVHPHTLDQLLPIAKEQCGTQNPTTWLFEHLTQAELAGLIARLPDGSFGPRVR